LSFTDPPVRVTALKDMLVGFGVTEANIHYPFQDFEAGEVTFTSYTIVLEPTNQEVAGTQFSVQQNVAEIQVRMVDGTTIGTAEQVAQSLLKQFVNAATGVAIRSASFEVADLAKISAKLKTVDFVISLECGLEVGEV